MKLYIRKLNSQQCTNKSISVTMPIFQDFFEDKDVITVRGKKSGKSGAAPFTFTRDREDPRFGGIFKEVLRAEGDGSFKIGDILVVEKASPDYIVSLVTNADFEYETYNSLLTNGFHSEIFIDDQAIVEDESVNIFEDFTQWLTSFDNPDYTGKEKYEGYPRALQRLTQFMKEKGYIEDDNLNDKNINKYINIKSVYDVTEEVKEFDEKYLSSKAGIAALKKYIKYIEFLNKGRVPKFSFKTSLKSDKARNRIVFGAPGTGKSHTLEGDRKELLYSDREFVEEGKDLSAFGKYERVTFHPDYSYANFVGTYKPVPCVDKEGDNAITYSYVPGPFMRTYVNALKNSMSDDKKPYLLLIEEINRANVAAVFGDVFQLLDRDVDNVSEYPIQASEDIKNFLAKEFKANPEEFKEIRIPDNMFIWATMNSADQGVFPMDTAFKRRWDFSYRGIDEGEEKIKSKYVELGKNEYSRKVEWNELRKAINDELLEYGINEDKLMGPYFISKLPLIDDTTIDAVEFKRIFKNKVLMYLFDDAAKQKRPSLFNGCQKPKLYSAVCNDFEEKGVSIFCERIRDKFLPSSTVNNDEN